MYLTITRTGKRKRMPKTIILLGKREKVHRPEWKLVQKLELQDFRKRMRKMI